MSGRTDFPTAMNFPEFQVAVADSFLPLRLSTHRSVFKGSLRHAVADNVHLTDLRASGHTVERTADLVAQTSRGLFKVSLMLEGTGLLVQDGREATLQPGDLAIYDTDRPYSLVFDDDFRSLIVMFDKEQFDLPTTSLEQLTAVRFSGHDGLASTVVPFLAHLTNHLDQLARPTGPRLAHNVVDLLSTLLAGELAAVSTDDPHEQLAAQIRDYIESHLGSADLDPPTVAAANYISTRHLHAIFQECGTTVSTWIRLRRLEHCRRDLLDPFQANSPIGQIAARWGFLDAAHFSRIFKAAYGHSPRELRATARTASIG